MTSLKTLTKEWPNCNRIQCMTHITSIGTPTCTYMHVHPICMNVCTLIGHILMDWVDCVWNDIHLVIILPFGVYMLVCFWLNTLRFATTKVQHSDTRPVTNCWDTTYLVTTVMATFGKIEEFDSANEDWPQYEGRLSYYFVANGIESTEKKHTVLLTVVVQQPTNSFATLWCQASWGKRAMKNWHRYCLPTSTMLLHL